MQISDEKERQEEQFRCRAYWTSPIDARENAHPRRGIADKSPPLRAARLIAQKEFPAAMQHRGIFIRLKRLPSGTSSNVVESKTI